MASLELSCSLTSLPGLAEVLAVLLLLVPWSLQVHCASPLPMPKTDGISLQQERAYLPASLRSLRESEPHRGSFAALSPVLSLKLLGFTFSSTRKFLRRAPQ